MGVVTATGQSSLPDVGQREGAVAGKHQLLRDLLTYAIRNKLCLVNVQLWGMRLKLWLNMCGMAE